MSIAVDYTLLQLLTKLFFRTKISYQMQFNSRFSIIKGLLEAHKALNDEIQTKDEGSRDIAKKSDTLLNYIAVTYLSSIL